MPEYFSSKELATFFVSTKYDDLLAFRFTTFLQFCIKGYERFHFLRVGLSVVILLPNVEVCIFSGYVKVHILWNRFGLEFDELIIVMLFYF